MDLSFVYLARRETAPIVGALVKGIRQVWPRTDGHAGPTERKANGTQVNADPPFAKATADRTADKLRG